MKICVRDKYPQVDFYTKGDTNKISDIKAIRFACQVVDFEIYKDFKRVIALINNRHKQGICDRELFQKEKIILASEAQRLKFCIENAIGKNENIDFLIKEYRGM